MSTPGLSRIDSGSSPGWLARLYRDKRTYSKFFADGKHGGSAAAQRAAEYWLGQTAARLPPPEPNRHEAQANSQSGVVGISPGEQVRDGQATLHYWSADVVVDGRHYNKKFYWSTLEERQSQLAAARRWRATQLAGKGRRRHA